MTIGDKVGGVTIGDQGVTFGSAAPDFPKRIYLKPTVRLFSMKPVAVLSEIWHSGQRYNVRGCAEGATVDDFGNVFHGWNIEAERII